MADIATIEIFCPAMPVFRKGIGKFETAREPCTLQMNLPDGSTVKTCSSLVIPPTEVTGVFPSQKVAACVGMGTFDDGSGDISWELPAEPVLEGIAQPINTTGTITMNDGSQWRILLTLGAAKTKWIGLGEFEAESVYAVGSAILNE
jgi:hypothetical protein